MPPVKTPLIVTEDWDTSLFGTVAEAESYLEPIDVAGGAFRGYDVEGRLLRIETDGIRVRIRAAEEKPTYAGELEDLLRGFLERVDEPVEPGSDLRCLLAACEKYTIREPESFRAVLALFFDLVRTLLGRRLGR